VGKDTLRGYVLVEIPAMDALRRTGRRFDLDAVVNGRVPAGTFTRKTVIVGVELPEESFRVARGLGREMRYGYEIHALTASALIAGAVPRKLGLALEGWLFLLVGAFGAGIGYTTKRFSRWPAAALLAAVAVGYFVVTVLIFAESGILPNTGYDLVSLLCSFGLVRSLSRRWLPWTFRPGHGANA
jgi:CHASE2 domain-containing sensor protein